MEYLIKQKHKELIHPGGKRLFYTLRKEYLGAYMRKLCDEEARSCKDCQGEKIHGGRTYSSSGNLHTETLMEDICMDILGPIDTFQFKEGEGAYQSL